MGKLFVVLVLFCISIQAQTPTPSPMAVDEYGRVKAASYDTWNASGSYKVAGQPVLTWDPWLSNFTCGKVSGSWQTFYGSQNFLCGNMVYIPTTGIANTSFGWDTGRPTTGGGNTFFGHDSGLGITTGSFNTFVGMQAGPPFQAGTIQVNESIGIGRGAVAYADHQLVLGGEAVGYVTDGYMGGGVTTTTPRAMVLQTTGGRGNNVRGWSLTIAGGKSTGSATPGSIFFATSVVGPSGTGLQPLVKRWEITGEGHLKAVGPATRLQSSGVILKSQNGKCFALTVDDFGSLATNLTDCL